MFNLTDLYRRRSGMVTDTLLASYKPDGDVSDASYVFAYGISQRCCAGAEAM